MTALSGSELLFYAGIVIMCLAAMAAVICVVIFKMTKGKIRKILEQEYGTWPK